MTGLRPIRFLPWLGLALMLAITYQLWDAEQHNADQDLQDEFNLQVQEATDHIKQRMLGYEQMLCGVNGLFAASSTVTRNEFREYVSSLRLKKNYPGIQGVGFLPLVTPDKKAKHIAAVRREGFPEYTIKPEGERDIYAPITYLEPFSGRNLRAFGFDRYSEPTRREGMDQARDLNEAIISGKVKLVIETSQNAQAGFLMNIPVYKNGMPHETLADRRANIIGWVTATFRMDDLMAGTLGKLESSLDIEIFDGEKIAEEALMHDSDNVLSIDRPSARYQVSSVIQVAGRPWTVVMRSLPKFDARLDRKKPRAMAVSGVAVSLLLFLLIWLLIYSREQTMRMASHLAESEASLRATLDNSPYMIWQKGPDGRYLAVNEVFLRMTGQKRMQDVLGKTDLNLWPKELAEKYRADDADVMASRQQKYIEEPALDGDKTYWVETFKTPVIDENGNVLGTTGFARDVSERKAFEEELKRSNIELEQFSYAVSHDMRQPLRMISSYLQLIEMSLADQLDGEKRDYFNFAIDGAKRIDQMLVALLEYSRVGRMAEPPTWIESRAVLDEALQFLQPAIAEAQANLNITGDWPCILASHDEILRLLQNLIGNAAKYRIAGRIPEITVSGEMVRNEWHLCVADNGVGIIPDQIKRLFQVFQRLQSRDAYEGTGIGLALCRKIAEHHKGRIWAESKGEGQGSRFYVILPVLQKSPPKA